MTPECVFCDRTKFEHRLIAENNDWYVAATLGQIVGGYALVIPKAHIPCIGALAYDRSGSGTKAMLDITNTVHRALARAYQDTETGTPPPVTVFEHGIVGQTIKHAHLHLVPTMVDLTTRIQADFPESEIEDLWYPAHLPERYQQRQEPYLFWTDQSGQPMICWNPPAPAQYFRLILAELLGCPERGNWRTMDPELDKNLGEETIARLKPYFI